MLHHMEVCLKKETRDVGQYLLLMASKAKLVKFTTFDSYKIRELVAFVVVMHELQF